MEAIPEVFGVEDSDELDESLQEDAQAATAFSLGHQPGNPGLADGFLSHIFGKKVPKMLRLVVTGTYWNHGIWIDFPMEWNVIIPTDELHDFSEG